jgi:glycosyltransferase involved in cell wall biosynthesis
MTDDPPLVSIVIPCYNVEAYVGKAIESVLGQTYDPIEIIVVDDGSEDDSVDVIQSYQERITLYRQENKGAPAARNQGTRKASGSLLKFLDADDLLYPEAIERQVSQMRQIESERAIVFGDGHYFRGEDGDIQEASSYRTKK